MWVKHLQSIIPTESLAYIVQEKRVILEEPEHLFWFQPWSKFKQGRDQVLGIIHTNYQAHRLLDLDWLHRWPNAYDRRLMQRMCHQIVALSNTRPDITTLPHSIVSNINGVNPWFFQASPPSRCGYYFIGKLMPSKGLPELFANLQAIGQNSIDLFGSGNRAAVTAMAARHDITPVFKGITHQPWQDVRHYKLFIIRLGASTCVPAPSRLWRWGSGCLFPGILLMNSFTSLKIVWSTPT